MLLRIKQFKIGTYGILALLIIVCATLLRILLAAWGWPHSNADEATMGIMAMHIAYNGEHPIFFYGQYYMGTLEAFVGAGFFRLFGISVLTLRLGPILFFTLFLINMYFLTSLLYTKKLALIVIALLSLGSSIMLDTELIALGGYPELLFFGSLSLLLSFWLALSYGQYSSPRVLLWRLIAYGCWGLVVSLGFWSDLLMLPFILISGFILLLFCWRELLKGAILVLVLGLFIGAFPLIKYNLHAVPGQDTLTVINYLHSNGRVELAQLSAHDRIPFGPQLRASLLTSLPATTGGTPFCFDTYTHFRLTGYIGKYKFPCSIHQGNLGLVSIALAWSFGFILLWTVSTIITLKKLWELCVRTPRHLWAPTEKYTFKLYFIRLMLLSSVVLILFLFVTNPMAVAFPANSRYLIGLLISTPALIAPLWGLSNENRVPTLPMSTGNTRTTLALFQLSGNQTSIKKVLGRGILLFIGIIFLLGTISAFLEIPTVQAYNRQQDALVHNLLQMKVTHIYTDYWTCNSIAFLSKENIICMVVDGALLLPIHNRYLPYVAIVEADSNAAYAFPISTGLIPAIVKKIAHSARHYQRFVIDGYVIYQPSQTPT